MLLKQEGAAMFSVDLSTRQFDGHVVVALGGELVAIPRSRAAEPMTAKDGLA